MNLVPKILLIACNTRSQGKKEKEGERKGEEELLCFCDTLSRVKIFFQTMAVIRLLPGPRHLLPNPSCWEKRFLFMIHPTLIPCRHLFSFSTFALTVSSFTPVDAEIPLAATQLSLSLSLVFSFAHFFSLFSLFCLSLSLFYSLSQPGNNYSRVSCIAF